MESQQLLHLDSLPVRTGGLSFIKDLDKYKHEKPYKWTATLDESKEHLRTNIALESRDDVIFRDVRSLIGQEDKLSVRNHGFQILRYTSIDNSAIKEESVLKEYVTGLAESIKEAVSAELVYCVNFVFRQCTRAMIMSPEDTYRKAGPPGSAKEPELPAFPAHAVTSLSAIKYSAYILITRSAWSPLYKPVQNAPLAFCHPATLSPNDVLEVDAVRPDRVTGVRYLKYKPNHQWYWCSNQAPNEVSVFKSWDSDPEDPLPFVPHGAVRFDLGEPTTSENADEVLRDSFGSAVRGRS
ncbi:hypothetical protein FALBO_6860 [Fusarium albosuccineum]|uniref:Uncharacterized protein n=1 Tax=Fusarium albosuccineum TaxID=1237068 RepID=A0A8H4PD01_9HYPO|nr:hypothetical protein FALBO_6860 [Fusarium albosuccineum]